MTSNEGAAVQREIGGLRSDIASLQRDMQAQHSTLKDAIDLTASLQRETNGRVKKAEVQIAVIEARDAERRHALDDREARRDRTIRGIYWGVTTAVTLLIAIVGWLVLVVNG